MSSVETSAFVDECGDTNLDVSKTGALGRVAAYSRVVLSR